MTESQDTAIADTQTAVVNELALRFDRFESRFDKFESRLESRFDRLESRIDNRFTWTLVALSQPTDRTLGGSRGIPHHGQRRGRGARYPYPSHLHNPDADRNGHRGDPAGPLGMV